eukprot:12459505-Ditylum_brightwellii.AAC.1
MEEMDLNFNKVVAVSQEKAKKDPFDKGKAIVMSDLMADIRKQYVNNNEEYDCGNPKDNVILALTTKLTHLESKLKESQSGGG